MAKGKKQHTAVDELMLSEEYAHLSSELERGVCLYRGQDLVLITPKVGDRARMRVKPTPLGALAPTLLDALGLEDALVSALLAHARPRCGACNLLAERSERIDTASWPAEGYIALVVDGCEEDFALEEQCELLGAERAVVDGSLIRRDDAGGLRGEPVLHLLSVSHQTEISREVAAWFGRGGGALRIVYFASRDAKGQDLQKVFKGWRCAGCGASFDVATRQAIGEGEPCRRCRGEGWLLVDDARLVACEDCDGFAITSPFSEYECIETKLKHVATRTIQDALAWLKTEPQALALSMQERLTLLCEGGFGDYPLGTAVELLSKGERALATVISARLSQISALTLAIDEGILGGTSASLAKVAEAPLAPPVVLFASHAVKIDGSKPQVMSEQVVTLRDLDCGPLAIESMTLEIGGVSCIQGDIGSGKSLLLLEIARRFAKRKKHAHLAAFGPLKKCLLIRGDGDVGGVVLDLLGLEGEIAREMARTRGARERGLVEDDFVCARSKHRCAACAGSGVVVDEVCSLCDGGLFDSRVSGVLLNGLSFGDLMRSSLAKVRTVLWSNDVVAGVIDRLPGGVREGLTLATPFSACAPSLRRFLGVYAPLSELLSRKEGAQGALVLVDTPFGTTSAYQGLIVDSIRELHSLGATIVCAGVPQPLESLFTSVLRLVPVDGLRHDLSRFYDVRMARRSELRVNG